MSSRREIYGHIKRRKIFKWEAIQILYGLRTMSHTILQLSRVLENICHQVIFKNTTEKDLHQQFEKEDTLMAEQLIEDREDIPPTPESARSRRGLLEVGGDVLGAVFGLATAADLKVMKSAVDNSLIKMEASTSRLTLSVQRVNHAVNATIQHVKRINSELEVLGVGISQFQEGNRILTCVRALVSGLESFYRDLLHFNSLTTLLSNEILPVGLISHEELQTLIKEGENLFPSLVFPLDATETPMSQVLPYLQVHPTRQLNMILLTIPYVRPEILTLTEIHPFPIIAHSETLLVNFLPSYVAVGNESFYDVPTLQHCRHSLSLDLYLCPPQARTIKEKSCAENLMTREEAQKIAPSCSFSKLHLPVERVYAVRSSQAWYLYFKTITAGTISCPDSTKDRTSRFLGD